MNPGKRREDVCTINNQIPAAALVPPLCLSLHPALPSFLPFPNIPASIQTGCPRTPQPDADFPSMLLVHLELLSCVASVFPESHNPAICHSHPDLYVLLSLSDSIRIPEGFFFLDLIKQTLPKHNKHRKNSEVEFKQLLFL